MAKPHPRPDRDGLPPYPGAPRWVKLLGIGTIGVVLLVFTLMRLSGGEHGPGRHFRSADAGGPVPPASATQEPAAAVDGLTDPTPHRGGN